MLYQRGSVCFLCDFFQELIDDVEMLSNNNSNLEEKLADLFKFKTMDTFQEDVREMSVSIMSSPINNVKSNDEDEFASHGRCLAISV